MQVTLRRRWRGEVKKVQSGKKARKQTGKQTNKQKRNYRLIPTKFKQHAQDYKKKQDGGGLW